MERPSPSQNAANNSQILDHSMVGSRGRGGQGGGGQPNRKMQAINDLIKLTQDKKVNKENAFEVPLGDTIGIDNMRQFFS